MRHRLTSRTARSRLRAMAAVVALATGACTPPGSGSAGEERSADPGDDRVGEGGATSAVAANATVVAVVDGDTVDLAFGDDDERVRLIGIDTPETKRPDAPVECYGPEATAFTERLLPAGTAVRVERDVENRDAYGRLLGYVYRAEDGIFVNYELVRQGYATPLAIEPNVAHAELFVDAARAAEGADAGLWAECSG
jgi:micrococcal nuclease